MTRRQLSSLLDDPPLPGTGRLSILAGGFFLAGIVCALDAAALVAAFVFPRLQWTPPPHPWIALATVGLLSTACLRAGWLLDRRRRSVGPLATIGGLVMVVSALGDVGQTVGLLMAYSVAVALAASVWRHLS